MENKDSSVDISVAHLVVSHLTAAAEDPMWVAHAEVSKGLLKQAAQMITTLTAQMPVKERMAPVQGYQRGIPWSMHLDAYDAYCKKYGEQEALIQGGCRGGFGCGELDMFIPGWRDKVSEMGKLKARIAELEGDLVAQRGLHRYDADAILAALDEKMSTWDPEREHIGAMELRNKYKDGDYYEVNEVRSVIRALVQAPAQGEPVMNDAEDATRLDWLNQQGESFGFENHHEGNKWEIGGPFNSVRAAIDAARKESK